MQWLCLGVGVNNFATGRTATSTLFEKVEQAVKQRVRGKVVATFGATGNLMIETPIEPRPGSLAAALYEASRTDWAVMPWTTFRQALASLEKMSMPETQSGARWTPGLSFAVSPAPYSGELQSTQRALLKFIGPGIVGVFKCDIEDERGRLDRTRRMGGWGGVSADIERQLGGEWTSRAISTLKGLERGVWHAFPGLSQ